MSKRNPLFDGMLFGIGMVSVLSVAYAAISWPATPSGETTGGKYSNRLTPAGAVMAFNLATCPTGWSDYTPAYGKFIRWIDKSGTSIDPSGLRTAGNAQSDAFQGHWHALKYPYTGSEWGTLDATLSTSLHAGIMANEAWGAISDGTNGTPRTANETRPKNVALLYCIKD